MKSQPQPAARTRLGALAAAGETAYVIGAIDAGDTGCTVVGDAETWGSREAWEAVHVA